MHFAVVLPTAGGADSASPRALPTRALAARDSNGMEAPIWARAAWPTRAARVSVPMLTSWRALTPARRSVGAGLRCHPRHRLSRSVQGGHRRLLQLAASDRGLLGRSGRRAALLRLDAGAPAVPGPLRLRAGKAPWAPRARQQTQPSTPRSAVRPGTGAASSQRRWTLAPRESGGGHALWTLVCVRVFVAHAPAPHALCRRHGRAGVPCAWRRDTMRSLSFRCCAAVPWPGRFRGSTEYIKHGQDACSVHAPRRRQEDYITSRTRAQRACERSGDAY